ncbi:MAG: kelch repeat-containing protein [Kofleriaceae bacterium]
MKIRGVIVSLFASACVQTQSVPCGDAICPAGTTCASYAGLSLCVTPDQRAACEGLLEGETCGEAASAGFCRDGACLPIGCGDGRIDDPIFATDEECDDGNRISHDGCSSTCKRETFAIERQSDISLVAVTNASMTFDEAADTVVLFGGAERNSSDTSRTWILVEDRWRLLSTLIAPSPRNAHAITYDARRQVIVLYGGATGVGDDETKFGDTWEFDGTAWTSRSSMTSPPARKDHALGYHPLRDETLMFGGRQESGTWAWDGVDWTELTFTRPSPEGGIHQAMAFDPVRGVMVLIIESLDDGIVTYELADDGWRMVAASGPARGSRTELAFDAVDRRIIAATDVDDVEATWSWDGTTWTSVVVPPGTLEQRDNAALATGSGGRVLRVGGNPSTPSSAFADTARWNGTSWEQLPDLRFEESVPGARLDFAASYDVDRRRVVLFGGVDAAAMGSGQFADMWELGPAGWTRVATVGPPARVAPTMAYDASRKVTLMFGDDTGGDARTWLWNGATWSSVAPPTGLEARPYSAMAYDAKRKVVVLFGGGDQTPLSDTWEWDGVTWTQKNPAKFPSPRSHHAMAYDPVGETVVLFGGRDDDAVFNDTWVWNGTTWRRTEATAVPTARFDHGLAWDPARASLVLVGGRQIDPTTPVLDVWEFDGVQWSGIPVVGPLEPQRIALVPGVSWGTRMIGSDSLTTTTSQLGWSALTAYETCTQADRDRDGLVGCADPDCWFTCP